VADAVGKYLKELDKQVRQSRPKVVRAQKSSHSILAVDDVDDVRELLQRRLTRAGYWVTTAEGGAQAIELLREKPFDLVVLDLAMPGVDGYDVLSEIKVSQGRKDLPVIILTAHAQVEAVKQCQQLGADDFVTKPFDFAVLDNKIRCCLGLLH